MSTTEHHRIIIVGAGFGGLGLGMRLLDDDDRDFVILERAPAVGGVWRDNTYPGCACDVPSHLYALARAPHPSWTHLFARQPEILAYLVETAARTGVAAHVRTEHELLSTTWDARTQRWLVHTSRGDFTCEVLVLATGVR